MLDLLVHRGEELGLFRRERAYVFKSIRHVGREQSSVLTKQSLNRVITPCDAWREMRSTAGDIES